MAKEITFTPATKEQSRGRVMTFGPSGSGKTYTGLLITFGLAGATTLEECADERWRSVVAVIDTEHGSAAKYSNEFKFSHYVMEPPYHPQHYINAIAKAEQMGFKALLVDGITHEWDGEGGVKEIVDKAKGQFGGNSQAAWSVGTPLHNKFFESILQSSCHIVATARAKTHWVPGEDSRGRSIFIKVGEAPMQRDTAEYEFDITMLLDMENNGTVSKSRVRPAFPPGVVIEKPGIDFAKNYLGWLDDGVTPPVEEKPAPAPVAKEADDPKASEEDLEQINRAINEVQENFGNHPEGMSWLDRIEARCQEEYGHGINDLTVSQANTIKRSLTAVRSKLAREAAGAAA